MKKFKFSLERVLRVKEINEDQQKKKFQQAQEHRQKQQKILDQMFNERERMCNELKSKRNHPLKVHQIKNYYNYLDRLEDHISYQQHRLKQADETLEQERQNWIIAKREKRALEKLKERKWEEYKQGWFKDEQKRLDEISIHGIFDFS